LLVTSLTTAANCSGVSPRYFLNLPDSARVEQPGCEQFKRKGRHSTRTGVKIFRGYGSWDARPASRVGNLVNEIDALGNEKSGATPRCGNAGPGRVEGDQACCQSQVIRASQIGLTCVHFLSPESVAGMATSPMENKPGASDQPSRTDVFEHTGNVVMGPARDSACVSQHTVCGPTHCLGSREGLCWPHHQ
jgi:hypothetical protein